MSVYEQLCEARNKIMFLSTPDREEKMKVLSQLMSLAFNNRLDLDKLPRFLQLIILIVKIKKHFKKF